MKKFLSTSHTWIAMLVTLFMLSISADAKIFTFTASTPLSQSNVTLTFTASPSAVSGGICNIYGNTWGTMTLTCSSGKMTKVEITCAPYEKSYATAEAAATVTVWDDVDTGEEGGTTNMTYTRQAAVWEGNPATSLKFGSSGDVEVLSVTVTTEDVGATTFMEYVRINPAEGTVSAKNGLRHFDIFMQDNFSTTYSTFWGHPIPAGAAMTDAKGRKYPISTFSTMAGSNQINVELAERIATPGTYTLTIPAGFNSGATGANPAMQFTWTVEPTTTFDIESSLVTPQDYPALKRLDSFSVDAPEGEVFISVQSSVTLLRQGRWDSAAGDFTYTPVAARATIVDGQVIFTLATPYVEYGTVRFIVPAGVITAASGLKNETFGASFTIDPYDYFTATPSIQGWTSYEAPFTAFSLTVPSNVVITAVGDAIEIDGMMTPLAAVTYDNTAHTVDITLAEPLAPGQHIISIPRGFVKASQFTVNDEIELYGVKILSADSDFPYIATTPEAWTIVSNATLAETPIVITFLRELRSADATKVAFKTVAGTMTVAEINALTPDAVTLATSGRDLTIRFTTAALANDIFRTSGQITIQLHKGAVTSTAGGVNDETLWNIGYIYDYRTAFTMSAAEWCPMAIPTTMEIPAGYSAYFVSAVSDESVTLSVLARAGETVNAYVPFILHGPAGTTYCSNGDVWDTRGVPSGSTNFLAGNYDEGTPHTYYAAAIATDVNKWDYNRDTPMGDCRLYRFTTAVEGMSIAFAAEDDVQGFALDVPQGEAFLIIPEYYTRNLEPKRIVVDDPTLTGLDSVIRPHDGEAIYNLQGQSAAPAAPGIYVKGGRKTIFK